jgi:transketolase
MVNNDSLTEVARRLRRHIVHMAADSPGAHVGGSMSVVEILTVLYFGGVLRIDAGTPGAPDRDRLIFSKGHSSAAYYAALAEAGFFPVEELATSRSWPPTSAAAPGWPGTRTPACPVWSWQPAHWDTGYRSGSASPSAPGTSAPPAASS